MSQYLLEFKKIPGTALMTYNSFGCLISFEHSGEWGRYHFIYFFERFPFLEQHLTQLKKLGTKSIVITQIDEDITFDRFWDEYDHKKGKKARVQKIWTNMSRPERVQALKYIKRYDAYLVMNRGVSKKYPETFLNTKEWEN